MTTPTFALIGAAGYVAPRHLKAIRDVGAQLVAALDLHDSVGILDSYFPECRFFTSPERFDRYLNKMSGQIDYVSICSPNWLHDAHCRWALRSGAHAICEKPVAMRPWNIDQLVEMEAQTGRRIYPVLQLRLHPAVRVLEVRLREAANDAPAQVDLTYVTRRGRWYSASWKGDEERSGGIVTNLGIHFFDLACHLFGDVREIRPLSCVGDPSEIRRGVVELERASFRWMLSTRAEDLPEGARAHRCLLVDEAKVDFTDGFEGLHTKVYEDVLAGRGPGLLDARAGIELVHRIREASK